MLEINEKNWCKRKYQESGHKRAELTGFLEKFKGNESFCAHVDRQLFTLQEQHVLGVAPLSSLEQSPKASLSLLANSPHSRGLSLEASILGLH